MDRFETGVDNSPRQIAHLISEIIRNINQGHWMRLCIIMMLAVWTIGLARCGPGKGHLPGPI
jgi:hypothetical protein